MRVPCDNTLNHGALLIGYGWDWLSDLDYWHIKNSYGADWGEEGFIRIARTEEDSA